MALKSIEEHNKEVHRKLRANYSTGIACPTCEKELQFVDNTVMLSYPPQKDVKCFDCGYTGRVFVSR